MLRATLATAILLMTYCGSALAETKAKAMCEPTAEASRNLVVSFYTKALIEKQVRAAFEQYVSPEFVEHKPDVPAGSRSVVVNFLEGLIKEIPSAQWEILRTVAEKDLVFLHARFSPAPGAPPYAIADVFRVENCTIVEHWDVVGPTREGMPNTNSRF
jgi:predicted SnoaL-like aldol condensation-catalyzing enzyme